MASSSPNWAGSQAARLGALAVAALLVLAAVLPRALPTVHGAPAPAAFSADEVDVVSRALLMARGDLLPLHADKPTFTHLLLAGSHGAMFTGRWAASLGGYTLADFERDFFLDPFPFFLAGRWISLAASLGTLALLAWSLRRFPAVAIAVGMVLLAWGGSSIHYARVAKEDALGALVTFAAFWAALRFMQERDRRGWLLASCFLAGLAVSTKYNNFFAGFFPLVAWWGAMEGRRRWLFLLPMAPAVLAGFAVGTPYIAVNPSGFLRETLSAPILTQVAGGYNILQYSENRGAGYLAGMAWREWGAGLAALVLGLGAFALRTRGTRALVFVPAGVYTALLALSSQLDHQYILPVAPVLAWAAAAGIAALAEGRERWAPGALAAVAASAVLMAGLAAASSLAEWRSFREGDARLRAEAYLYGELGLAQEPPERPLLILSNFAYRYHPPVALDRESHEALLEEALARGGSGRYLERAAAFAGQDGRTPLPARFLAFDTSFRRLPDGTREFTSQSFPLDPEAYAGRFSYVIVPSHTMHFLDYDAPGFAREQALIRAMTELPVVARFESPAALGPSIVIHEAP